MATDLSIRLYFSSPSSGERFAELVRAIDGSSMARREWRGLDVVERRPLQYRMRQPALVNAEQVMAAARGMTLAEAESMASQTSLRCWRRDGADMVEAAVVAYVEAWGDEFGRLNGEDLRMMGRAAVTLAQAGPFVADITGAEPRYNEKVEANLEALMALLVELTNALQPDALKVFDEQGLYLPFNAHVAYFRNADAVLDDIALMRDAWNDGLPEHRVGPLGRADGAEGEVAMHRWRTELQRRQLHERMGAALAVSPAASDVNAVVASGRFDTLTKGESFFVLEYPHYLNAFVDRFYLEVLEQAGQR